MQLYMCMMLVVGVCGAACEVVIVMTAARPRRRSDPSEGGQRISAKTEQGRHNQGTTCTYKSMTRTH